MPPVAGGQRLARREPSENREGQLERKYAEAQAHRQETVPTQVVDRRDRQARQQRSDRIRPSVPEEDRNRRSVP